MLVRGDTGLYKFQRLDSSGNPITTPPDAMFFTVKKSYGNKGEVFQKTLDDMDFDNTDNCWHFVIAPSDTQDLDYGQYVYDLEVTTDTYVQTIAKGKLVLDEEATWAANK